MDEINALKVDPCCSQLIWAKTNKDGAKTKTYEIYSAFLTGKSNIDHLFNGQIITEDITINQNATYLNEL